MKAQHHPGRDFITQTEVTKRLSRKSGNTKPISHKDIDRPGDMTRKKRLELYRKNAEKEEDMFNKSIDGR